MKKSLISILLVLVFVMGLMGSVFATGPDTESIVGTGTLSDIAMAAGTESAEDTEAVSGTYTEKDNGGSLTVINPLYPDYEPKIVDSPELCKKAARLNAELSADTYYSIESAGAKFRGDMVDRKTSIVLAYNAASEMSGMTDDDKKALFKQICLNLLDEALKHTGVGNEGDFLRWHYAAWNCSWSYNLSTGLCQYTYTMEYYTNQAQEAEEDVLIDKVEDSFGFNNNTSDYQKVVTIYDYLCDNITYDNANLNNTSYTLKYTAYAALVNKTAVCQGYANLFYRMALDSGVDARLIAGTGAGGNHAWNIVELNDKYYYLDSTWDAPNKQNGSSYSWFLMGSHHFSDHAAGVLSDGTTEYLPEEIYRISALDYSAPASSIRIVRQPQDTYVRPDDTFTFSIQATGTDLSYTWYVYAPINPSNIGAVSNNATWSETARAEYDGFRFYCIVTDGNGTSVQSNIVTLTVTENAGITITTQPADVSTAVGKTAKFSVVATGTDLSYQWQYQSATGSEWKNSSMNGSDTATISVPATVKRNGQKYRCIVSDGSGNSVTSEAALLTVTGGVTITTQPKSVSAKAGSTAKFSVVATGTGLSYQWQYRASSTGTWKNSGMTGNTTATISVPAAEKRNGQQYRCVVTDTYGNKATSSAATLTIISSGLAITSQPSSTAAAEGSTAKFTVKATGTGLSYQWQYYTASNGVWKNSGMTGSDTATISVPATVKRNGQKYRCVVTDTYGNKVTSKAATLTVNSSSIKIVTQPVSMRGSVGNTVVFSIEARGTGLSYQWQYKSPTSSIWKDSGMTGSKTNKLHVPVIEKRNGQQYRCVITDANGNTAVSDAVALTVR